jgi:two-component system response regulator DevR
MAEESGHTEPKDPGGNKAEPANRLRVLVVDDQGSVRQGLKMRLELESDIQVVGEAAGLSDGLALVQVLGPDIVILDVGLQDGDGIAFLREVRRLRLRSKVVVHTVHDDRLTAEQAADAGASSFIPKTWGDKALVEAIR